MGKYFDALKDSMGWLAEQPDTVFLGQAVRCPGTAMFRTLEGVVPMGKRIEFPVAEDMQMGASTGLALQGFTPVSVYPRWDFLILAANQLVNHLDRLPLMSKYRPRVIIRTAVGSVRPLDPQWQHKGDFTEAFRLLCRTVDVVKLEEAEAVLPAYQRAYRAGGSTLLVEVSDHLAEK